MSMERFMQKEILESKLSQFQKDTIKKEAESLSEDWLYKKDFPAGTDEWSARVERSEELRKRLYWVLCARKVKTVNPALVQFARAQERRESEANSRAVEEMRHELARAAGITRGLKMR